MRKEKNIPKRGKKLLQSKGKRKEKKYLINESTSRIKVTINNQESMKEIE